jgi:hypothetical protein
VRRRTRTQRLDVILIEAAFNVLDHQTRFSYLRIPDHPYFDDHAEWGVSSERMKMGVTPCLFFSSVVSMSVFPLDEGVAVDDDADVDDEAEPDIIHVYDGGGDVNKMSTLSVAGRGMRRK